jgi:hypothetical protein
MRQTIAALATNAFGSRDPELIHAERFCASSSWVDNFLERCGFCLRIPHAERRTLIRDAAVESFKRSLQAAKARYPTSRIFNFDETSWKCYLGPQKVVAEKGTLTVKLSAPRGEKECYTAYGCISAERQKLPFWILTKGKTNRPHAKFGAIPGVTIQHPPNGWTTDDMMVKYLEWLSQQCQGEPLLLVLDAYRAHRTNKVRQRAKELNVELVFVPAGGTSLYQPLDRRVEGELKSRARRLFFQLAGQSGVQGATPEQAITILVSAWAAISPENVSRAWEIM